MENFLVKEINFVEYVKAIDVANYFENKNYRSAIRFIHKTFAACDIHKTNGTLYVKKFAVEKYFLNKEKISNEKLELLEKRVATLEKEKVECKQKCQKFKDDLVKEYRKHLQALQFLDVPSYAEILLLLRGENEDFSEYANKKLKQLEKFFPARL